MVGLAAPTHPPIVAHCNQGGAVNTPPHSLAGGQLRDLTRMVQIFLFPPPLTHFLAFITAPGPLSLRRWLFVMTQGRGAQQ